MPATRKTPENVPGTGDPDRKRVLNVLAQRRYRQRRREKMAALEAQNKGRCVELVSEESAQCAPGLTATWSDSSLEDPIAETNNAQQIHTFGLPMVDFGGDLLDMQLLEDFNNSCSPSSQSSSSDAITHSNPIQTTTPPPNLTFPLTADGAQLDIPVLSAMRAAMNISTALGLADIVWDPNYMHTFPTSTPLDNLPPNLHPTPAQLTIPHHPFLDALPWPSIREKLICMLAMPSGLRPPVARDDEPGSMGQGLAVLQLTTHLDDYRDGIRVHGNMVGWGDSSEMVEEAWEIGECFFRNWWWCIDEGAVRITNMRRRERGLRPLRMKG
ncbi:unnamed protein product [Periconia digitata]|uniref:BZIP domain-containing protein n=1 Tax=Periconia digitata TaxID=1303443 RepID=A0A9W4U962_9PLEO|nr:unnamed protein product [Periconia digitata]